MISAASTLSKLEFQYRPAAGGLWDGTASLRMDTSGSAFQKLVKEGRPSVARIYWDRDDDPDNQDESRDLLWLGLAEDAQQTLNSELVNLRLRGAGRFLEAVNIGEQEFVSVDIKSAAETILDSVINSNETPITAKAVDSGNIMRRRVSFKSSRQSAARALAKLVKLAGGPDIIVFGVRPRSDSDNFAEAYFGLRTGHLYEKDNSVDAATWGVSQRQIRSVRHTNRTSDIRNWVEVIGAEFQSNADRRKSTRSNYRAVAQSEDSIALFGRRSLPTVVDSSLKSSGQCALVAAGLVREGASRKAGIEVSLLEPLEGGNQGGDASDPQPDGLLQTAIRNGQRVIPIRSEDRSFRAWGDTRHVARFTRSTSVYSLCRFDCRNGPTDAGEIVVQDVASGLSSGDKRLFVFKGKLDSVAYSQTGLYVCELDSTLAMIWVETSGGSGVWYLQIARKNGSGNWVWLATGGSTRTTAQLQAAHTVALEVGYQSATEYYASSYFGDGGTVVQMATATGTNSGLVGGGTNQFYLNGALTTAIDTTTKKGDCPSSKYASVEVWKAWAGTTVTFLGLHDNESPPFQRWGDLVFLANLAQTDDGSSSGDGWIRYKFGNTTLSAEYGGKLSGDSGFEEHAELAPRGYSWLLGDRRAPVTFGGHFELFPTEARVLYRGPLSPLHLVIKGTAGTEGIAESVDGIRNQMKIVEENLRSESNE